MSHIHPKMSTSHRRHLIINYLLLFFIFFIGGLTLILVDVPILQDIILLTLAGIYITWGLWHHHEHKTLSRDVVLEYIGVAGIIVLIYLLAA